MKSLALIRKPIMAFLFLTLLLAIWAGLNRMGWSLPPLRPNLSGIHGPLMVSGFLGSLIALERVVALSHGWAYSVPLAGCIGAILLVFDFSAGPYLLTLSSLGLALIYIPILRRQYAIYTVTMALGAVALLGGNIVWLTGGSIHQSTPWWLAFLILTIAGERLEISRVLKVGKQGKTIFSIVSGVILVGLVVSLYTFASGVRVAGLGFTGISLWLIFFDIARRTVRKEGVTRFIALNLLTGYVWLAAGGVMTIIYGQMAAGFYYDAWIHAIFLGFVFSMIFAHALIILPAVAGISIPYHPVLLGPIFTMQTGLILRVVSDLLLSPTGRLWGGMINGISLLWFLLTLATLAIIQVKQGNRNRGRIGDGERK